MKKKMLAWLLTACMLISALPMGALAAEVTVDPDGTDGFEADGQYAEEEAEEQVVVVGKAGNDEILLEDEEGEASECYETAYGVSDPRVSGGPDYYDTTWDCIWFGAYPQAEVVSSKEMMTDAVNEAYLEDGDYIVDANLYARLQNTSGWVNNETTLDGVTYRRMRKSDALDSFYSFGYSVYYGWSDDTSWHYFRYSGIKWRVLDVDGSTALLLADEIIDERMYNETYYTEVAWPTCTLRSWLNGYGADSNSCGINYYSDSYIDSAFTLEEQGAILNETIKNSIAGDRTDGCEGSTDTTDRIFLLSYDECCTKDYGYSTIDWYNDKARRARPSAYAKAQGARWSSSLGIEGAAEWWVRSMGRDSKNAIYMAPGGTLYYDGTGNTEVFGVRPALRINLAASCWSYAGTIRSNGTVNEQGEGRTNGNLENWQCGDNVWAGYNTVSNTLIISGTGAMWDYESWEDLPWKEYLLNIENLTIMDGVTRIGAGAFTMLCSDNGDAGTVVTMTASVTEVGDNAFEDATIEAVDYYGLLTDKQKITIGSGNNALKNAEWNYMEGATVDSVSLTIEEGAAEIGLNFYVKLPADANTVKLCGKEVTIPDREADGTYKFTTYFSPKDIATQATLSVSNWGTPIPINSTLVDDKNEFAFSIAEYCGAIGLASLVAALLGQEAPYSAEMVDLATALLNYGNSAAYYFGTGTEEPTIEAQDFSTYAARISSNASNMEKYGAQDCYYGSSLILGSTITARHYFLGNPENIFVDGQKASVYTKDDIWYYVDVEVSAYSLAQKHTVSIGLPAQGIWAMKWCPLSYCAAAMRGVDTEGETAELTPLQNLVCCMYCYGQASIAYRETLGS